MAGLYVFCLIYTHAVRIHILYKIQMNVISITTDDSLFSLGYRTAFTAFLNTVLYLSMILLLGLQFYNDNLTEIKPAEVLQKENDTGVTEVVVTPAATYMLVTTLLAPILSVVTFVLANYYYLLEVMIKVNVCTLKSRKLRNKVRESGETGDEMLDLAKDNIHATPGQLRDLHSLNAFQRVFYILREWWADLLFLCWISVLGFYCYFCYTSVDSDLETLFPQLYISSFVISASILALTNFHVILIVIVAITLFLPLVASLTTQTVVSFIHSLLNYKDHRGSAENEERTKD